MAELYTNLYNQVKHPEYKGIFSRLAIEERQHESLINNIMDSFGK